MCPGQTTWISTALADDLSYKDGHSEAVFCCEKHQSAFKANHVKSFTHPISGTNLLQFPFCDMKISDNSGHCWSDRSTRLGGEVLLRNISKGEM